MIYATYMEGSGRVKLILFLFGLLILLLALFYGASFMQTKQTTSSTGSQRFTNPFTPQADNPFTTESSYQNPFETTKSSEVKYKNPFENLK